VWATSCRRTHALPTPSTYSEVSDFLRLTVYFSAEHHLFHRPHCLHDGASSWRLDDWRTNGEIIAMKAAGVPLKRMVLPVILVGGLLSALCFYLQRPGTTVHPGPGPNTSSPSRCRCALPWICCPRARCHHFGDWQVYIGRKELATRTRRDIDIPDGKGSMYFAESAQLITDGTRSQIVLKNAYTVSPERDRTFELGKASETVLDVPEDSRRPKYRKTSARS